MIDNFRNWISALLCIGIFISILELILPKNNIKKYVYVLVGIVTTITIISPGINLLMNDDIAKSVTSIIDNFSPNVDINGVQEYDINRDGLIKKEFVNKFKKDVENKLTLKGINVIDVNIDVTDEYNLEKLQIKVKHLNGNIDKINEVINYINSEYKIDYSVIEVIESGVLNNE